VTFLLRGDVAPEGQSLPDVGLEAEALYELEKGGVQAVNAVTELHYDLPEMPTDLTQDRPAPLRDRVLRLDGKNDCVLIESHPELNPSGPFTVECWAKLDPPGERAALLAKTQSSSYAIFLADGESRGPVFYAYFEGKGYSGATGEPGHCRAGSWAHYAGVFDGETVRLFVDGKPVAEVEQEGRVRGNALPLIVGADVDSYGRPVSFAGGLVDEVRLSQGALYTGPFEPERRLRQETSTLLLLHFDTVFGNLTPDTSGKGHHGRLAGGAQLVDAPLSSEGG
jgi:hypothetical protein